MYTRHEARTIHTNQRGTASSLCHSIAHASENNTHTYARENRWKGEK